MNLFKKLTLIFVIALTSMHYIPYAISVADLHISEEELKSLGLSPEETSQFKELVDALQNLPPEELKALEELGQQLENDMRTQGLDPSNADDIFKWVDSQTPENGKEKAEPAAAGAAPAGTAVSPAAEASPEPDIVQIATPVNAQHLLSQTNALLTKLRQKASLSPKLYYKLERLGTELDKLQSYLNIMEHPGILKYFTSQEFEKLYKKIQNLHEVLSNSKFLIAQQTTVTERDDSNPYEILRVPYNASQEEIDKAFNDFRKEYDPEYLASKLEAKGINGKAYKDRIKEANIMFPIIKDAYETLSDSKLRSVLDRTIKAKKSVTQELKTTQEFEKILQKLNYIISQENLLQDIQKLLEKYKPEEEKLAKAQEELEKKVYQRSQQRQKLTTTPQPTTYSYYNGGEFSNFQRELDRYLQRAKNLRYPVTFQPQQYEPPKPNGLTPTPSQQKTPAKNGDTKAAGAKDKKDTKDKPKDTAEAKEKTTDTKTTRGKKEDKPSADETTKAFVLVEQISQKLKNASTTIELPQSKRSMDPIEAQASQAAERVNIKTAMDMVTKQLKTGDAIAIKPTKGKTVNLDAIDAINTYAQKNDLYGIANSLYSLNKLIDEKKISSADLAKEWKDKVSKPYEKLINTWFKEIQPVLNPRTPGHPGVAPKAAAEHYNSWRAPIAPDMVESDHKKYREGKQEIRLPRQAQTKPSGAPLAWIALDIKDIHNFYKKINDKIGGK